MSGGWRIKEFAARTGTPEPTLRAWERRYGLVEPARSAGGYRLYSAEDERRVLAMQAHMERGLAAGEAAALARDVPAAPPPVGRDPATLVQALLAATAAYDAMALVAALDAAFALGTATGMRDVLLPALGEIGRRWQRGELTVAHEHFASHLCERRLLAAASGWENGGGPLALLASPPGERHALGLLCFGVALADRGWRVSYLGADTPVADLEQATARLAPAVVVLSATDPERFTDAAESLRALAARVRVLVGGAGATTAIARRLRAERLAGDPVTAAAELG